LSPSVKIHYAVYGSGLGHAARTCLLADALKPTYSGYFTSWGEGLNYLRAKGHRVAHVPPVDVEWGVTGRMAFRKTLRRFPHPYANVARQVLYERRMIAKMKPILVLSDSRLSAVLAAWSLGVRSVLLINQLRISLPPVAGGLRFPLERATAELLALGWDRSSVIIAPDLPPPYTISEQQLWNVKVAEPKVNYVGFLLEGSTVSPEAAGRVKGSYAGGKKMVFAHISGPQDSRAAMFYLIRKAAAMLGPDVSMVVSLGDPKGDTRPKRGDGFTFFEWCPIKDELMEASDLVLARGGHTTVAQVMKRGKVGLFLPIPYHGEQWGNSVKAEKLGFAKALDPLSTTPRSLVDGIYEMLEDEGARSRAERLKLVAERYDGVANSLAIIRRCAS
jgi:UDP:flavonoid glycosyltransferase YjiC (YdhE family)